MGLLSWLGSLGDDTYRENHGESQPQTDGGEYEKGWDTVIRHEEDTPAHTTWHWDTEGNVRGVNRTDDDNNYVQRDEFDEDGNKIN